MSGEEIDVLYNEILNLPKVERPIPATTQCEINVNDLFDTIRAFRKIPDYNELIKDNRKKDKEIERLNNIINELEKDLYKIRELTFNKYNSNEWNNCLSFNDDILPVINRIKELKGSDK